ncbi:3D-(3,5/4)-trihydroxycyclohexane-1,2-dione acylhydrolase (decyclizing) [Raineyella sp. W15-4]|uniref:3D-(3,5/4)-trihydroxycyclohexane-1,2-dione acylhydrolase (decyclizing) n=1 Tax=Raineyella sp. W15-4 TaxID=3081651 RepID=UPI002954F4B7|nr:3D-(3,5/4)-trihydroxycyclohexane-1,2-dione acylhydrolase (decyclizing) [Raineyella sp. W15-4]WOQ16541.1 3D-(3,5/4)-trihydroxycyclohexane-1,2-dione acylhydrolase (decyclizing) [Raineyella sp. W15-4]
MTTQHTVRLTVGQAIVRFLAQQRVERDGITAPFFGGAFGIFGHGNVAGIGQALLQYREEFPYHQGRNEQGLVHAAIGYAKAKNRLGALAVTTSIGPGAANMITGAGTATSNRLPVLLLPSDYFATRRTGYVLQQIEDPTSPANSTNDAFRAVSRFWDRVSRPEQLSEALLGAMRVLTSPADTGAATVAVPQDVQAEAYDFPVEFFRERVWYVPRARADLAALHRAADAVRQARRPLIIAGGGVIYSEATEALESFVEATGIPVGVTQAGKASLRWDHPLNVGALGASGSKYANQLAAQADLIIGIGTRYTDFTSASNTLFQDPDVRFLNLNVQEFDAYKEGALAVIGDARESLRELGELLGEWRVPEDHRRQAIELADEWRHEVDRIVAPDPAAETLPQAVAIGIVNTFTKADDVVINAAGSMPGDLHRVWRPGGPLGYGIEYGYSCMGYEIAAGVGAKLADRDREVFTFIGDGTYLMLSAELLTSVQEGLKQIVILVDNKGYGSIEALSKTVGSQGFGCRFLYRDQATGQFSDRTLDIDFAQNAASYGATVYTATTADELRDALAAAVAGEETAVIYTVVDAQGRFGGSGAWWEVPVPQVAEIDSSNEARGVYDDHRATQRLYV